MLQEGSEWKTKHDIIKERLEEAGDMQGKYRALESQYAALTLLVRNTDTSTVVQVSPQGPETFLFGINRYMYIYILIQKKKCFWPCG